MVLQRDRRTEQRHDAIAGELVHRTAVALDHSSAPVEEIPHDLAQSLGIQDGGQIHRPHDVGEEDRHLFVLGRRVNHHDRGSAGVAEPGAGARLGTTPPAR